MLDRKSGSLRGLTRRNVLAAGASLAAPLFIGSGARAATGERSSGASHWK